MRIFPKVPFDIIAATGICIAIMILAIAKILGVNERLGLHETWDYMFIGMGISGIILMVWIAIVAIREHRD